jgi:hypothetical protein
VIPFYVSRHQQKIPWMVSSLFIWPLITTADQSETIPFMRSGFFPFAIAGGCVIDPCHRLKESEASS